jgi:hypothetical protein
LIWSELDCLRRVNPSSSRALGFRRTRTPSTLDSASHTIMWPVRWLSDRACRSAASPPKNAPSSQAHPSPLPRSVRVLVWLNDVHVPCRQTSRDFAAVADTPTMASSLRVTTRRPPHHCRWCNCQCVILRADVGKL